MTKKLFAIIMAVSFLFTLMPAGLSASAADPAGTIIVKNDTSTYDDERFYPYTNPSGDAKPSAIGGGIDSSYGYVPSKYTDDSGHTAIRSKTENYSAWYRLLPDGVADASKAGVYDIYFYNIADTGKDEQLWNGSKMADTHPDYHAQYTVYAAGVQTTYYIDQLNILNGQDGWVKLGTHYFDGVSGEKVVVTKNYVNGSSTYLSTFKFVPVDNPGSAKLIHMNIGEVNSDGSRGYTAIGTEETEITSNNIVRQIPNTYADGRNRGKKIRLTFTSEDPDATIVVGSNEAKGKVETEYYADANIVEYKTVTVTSQNGTKSETYNVAIGVDGATVIDYKAEDATLTKVAALNESNQSTTNLINWGNVGNASASIAVPDGYTKKAQMYGLGDTAKWTVSDSQVTAPGYYSLYVWGAASNGFSDEKAEIIVNHAGLREARQVTIGYYHKNNPKWVYAGSYYFEGTGTETIAVMKTSASHDSAALELSGVKLVSCNPTDISEDFDGVTITAAGETVSVTKELIEGGKYIQPLQPENYTSVQFKVIGSNSNYDYIKVNGAEIDINTAMDLAVNGGAETSVKIEIKLAGKKANVYKLVLYKEVTNVTVGAGGNLQNVEIPVSTDFSSKVATVKNASADAGFRLENLNITEDAYYKILVWKPSFNYHVKSNNTQAATGTAPKAMASNEQPITINTGEKIIKKTIDWSATESGWVDLGTYKMKPSGFTDTTTEFCVTFGYLNDAYTLINKAKYLKLSNGLLIDGEFYSDKDLDDNVIYTGADTINITPMYTGSVVKINDDVAPDNEAYACEVENGLNRIKVAVGDNEINFAVVKNGEIIAHNDSSRVDIDGTLGLGNTSGYSGLGVSDIYDTTATIDMPAGSGKLSVWFDALTDDLTNGGFSSAATVTAGDASKTITITQSGWYEIGTFTFAEGDDVTIAVSGDNNLTLFSAVMLESADAVFDIVKPVIEIGGKEVTTAATGNANAWTFAYNAAGAPKNASLILAVYNKDENGKLTLLYCKSSKAAINGFQVIKTETGEVAASNVIKAFLWDTATIVPMTVETVAEAAAPVE